MWTLMLLTVALVSWPGPARADPGLSGGATVRGEWPLVPRPQVIRGFDPPDLPWGAGHRGVDLAASIGQEVHAAAAGVVSFAGPVAGRGVVAVVHGSLRTTYEPVAAVVSVGDRVPAGGLIGYLEGGSGHCVPVRPCLHWGLLRGREYLDPLSMLWRGPSRLLPIWGVPPPYPARLPYGPGFLGGVSAPPASAPGIGEPDLGPAVSVPGQQNLGWRLWPPPPAFPVAAGTATAAPVSHPGRADRGDADGVLADANLSQSSAPGHPARGGPAPDSPLPGGSALAGLSLERASAHPAATARTAGESDRSVLQTFVLKLTTTAGAASVLGLTGIACLVQCRPRRSQVGPFRSPGRPSRVGPFRAPGRHARVGPFRALRQRSLPFPFHSLRQRSPRPSLAAAAASGPDGRASGDSVGAAAGAGRQRMHRGPGHGRRDLSCPPDCGTADATAPVEMNGEPRAIRDGCSPLAGFSASAPCGDAGPPAVTTAMQRWELGVPAAPEPVSKLRSSPAPTADPDGADEDAAPIGGDVVDLTAERLRRRVDPPPQPA